MQTDLSRVNKQEFFMRPCLVGGEQCVLIEPHGVGVVTWNKDNLIFRSSIWTIDGKLVSAGLPKFFNWDEDLDRDGVFVPGKLPLKKPETLANCAILDKLDGSQLIVSFWKGEMIIRTRGTVSAEDTLSNGDEIPFLKKKYEQAFKILEEIRYASNFGDMGVSYHFEWTSPRNRIVLDYGDEPQLWLIAAINHADYSFLSQADLDVVAAELQVPRPERYPSMTLEQLRQVIAELRNKEGVVLYDGNWPWKIKSLRYLALHYSKGRVNTIDKVIDIWLEMGQPEYQAFFDALVAKEDWETAEYARPSISLICDHAKQVQSIIAGMDNFIAKNLAGKPRKEQYQIVIGAYGQTPRASMVMTRLDGKPLKNDMVRKLMLQLMKK